MVAMPRTSVPRSARPPRRSAARSNRVPLAAARSEAAAAASSDAGLDFSGLAVLERLLLRTPVRLLRARNNVLDVLFYDVDTLPPGVRHRLLRWSDPDGSIVVVCPGDARHREVHHYEHAEDFLASKWARSDAVAIAGVGSSALGTAALAANVADGCGRPVVGIVSGYGLVDAFAEGLTGWFVLRTENRLRQWGEWWSGLVAPMLSRISRDTQPNGDPWRLVSYVRGLPESETLDWLIRSAPSQPVLLVGHSKGNLSIATALHQLGPEVRDARCRALDVVTIGAMVPLPALRKTPRQLIGTLDAFGWFNSLLPQRPETIPGATHTTNTEVPFAIRVRDELAPVPGVTDAAPASRRRARTKPPAALPWQLWASAAIAFQAAASECVRSLMQGTEHARRRTRARRRHAVSG
jgi:hypothetical protein